MIRVGIADDHVLLREGIAAMLEASGDFEVAWSAKDGREAVEAHSADPVDVVLMDVRMPRMGGVEACALLTERRYPPRVVMLTTYNADEAVVRALRVGASGFLLKDTDPADLVAAVLRVHQGRAVLSADVVDGVVADVRSRETGSDARAIPAPRVAPVSSGLLRMLEAVSAREREVLALVAQGLTNGEIANDLVIAETTVKSHVRSLFMKLGQRDRVGLVVFAHQIGLARTGGED